MKTTTKKLSPPFYHSLDFHNFYKLNDNLFLMSMKRQRKELRWKRGFNHKKFEEEVEEKTRKKKKDHSENKSSKGSAVKT